jgi:predicted RNA binding protein YcfA (HicA-like mRNA interferase family)
MTKLPSISGVRLIRALKRLGFEAVRTKGSHHFLRHPDGRCTVIPVHRGETLGRGILAQILRDCEITREELQNII